MLNTEKITNNTPGHVFLYEYLKGLFFFIIRAVTVVAYTSGPYVTRFDFYTASVIFPFRRHSVGLFRRFGLFLLLFFFFTPRKPTLSFAVYFTLGDTLSLSRHRVARRYIYYSGIVNSKLLQIGFGGYTL